MTYWRAVVNKEDDQPAPLAALAALSDAQAIDFLMRVLMRVEGRASALTSTHLVPMVRTIAVQEFGQEAHTQLRSHAQAGPPAAEGVSDVPRDDAQKPARREEQRAAVCGDAEIVSDLSAFESPGDAPRLPEGLEASDLQPKVLNLELEED